MQSKNVDLFGSFLSSSAAEENALPAVTSSAQVEGELLKLLSEAQNPLDLKTLVTATSGSATETLKILDDMTRFKLIEKRNDGTFTITDLGHDLTAS